MRCRSQVLSVYTTFPRPFFPRDFRTVRRAGPKPREPMEPMEPREPKEPKEKEPDASKDFREAKATRRFQFDVSSRSLGSSHGAIATPVPKGLGLLATLPEL